jgi:PAS domain S-box-containing protein
MPGTTIRSKLILGFAVVIAVVVFLSIFSVGVSQRYLMDAKGDSSVLLAKQVLQNLNNSFQNRIDGLRQFGGALLVQRVLADSNRLFDRIDDPQRYLDTLSQSARMQLLNGELAKSLQLGLYDTYFRMYGYSVYSGVIITNRYGIAVAQDPRAGSLVHSDEPWCKQALQTGLYIGPVSAEARTGSEGIPVALPIFDEAGSLVGVIKANLAFEGFAENTIFRTIPRETTFVKLLTEQGKVVYSTKAYRFLEDETDKEYYRKIEGQSGYFISEVGGRKYLQSYARAAGVDSSQSGENNVLPWIFILGQDVRDIFTPVATLRTILSVVSGILVALCLLIVFMVTRQIIRPVAALTEGAEIVRAGDITHRIAMDSKDEIGTLARAFNEMLDKLESQTDSLKRMSSELEIIIDSVPGLVFYKDTENRYLRVNKFVADAHKVEKQDLEGKSCFDLYPQEQAQAYLEDDLQVIRSGHAKLNIDEPWETESGTRWVSTSKIPYFDTEGKAIGIIGVSIDVTERRQAEVEVREKSEQLERQNWIRTGQAELNLHLRGEKDLGSLSRDVIAFLAEYCGAKVGALFLSADNHLELTGRFAYQKNNRVPDRFAFGEGLVGQAAADGKSHLLTDVPADYITVGSALGAMVPKCILVLPILFADEVKGVIELGSLQEFSDLQMEFLESVRESIAIAVHTAQSRDLTRALLKKTQEQAAELQTQQEELQVSNEELEEQTQRLQASEESLRVQQEELQVSNEELEEKNELLERRSQEVEQARKTLEEKAEELALASKYKSEFLANMSHELRTPLNSLLLLAQSLAENKQGNLSTEQVEEAEVIYGSGNDLLNLINEILDLSKIEAGRMELQPGAVKVSALANAVHTSFDHLVRQKGLAFEVEVAPDAPGQIVTDRKRVEQVIKNLLSNALKFTESGTVSVRFGRPAKDLNLSRSGLSARDSLAIAVKDTGIGIAPEMQRAIFEAFQQADGSTSRTYGGTGLGLSISRELALLLGGEIRLESEPGRGSTFTLVLPVAMEQRAVMKRETERPASEAEDPVPAPGLRDRQEIADDRSSITKTDTVILVVEDDARFAGVLRNKCHEKGFKFLAASTGEEGLELAGKYLPHGMILDIRLPGMDGLAVLSALKEDMRTRHIPVHMMSVESASIEALRKGAVGFATKPLSQEDLEKAFERIEEVSTDKTRRVLVVEDDEEIRQNTVRLIRDREVDVDEAASGAAAIEALRSNEYGCLILDLGLPDMDGSEFLDIVRQEGGKLPPVIIHTARDLSRDQEMGLHEYAGSVVIKDVRSQERLLDEVSLFLHQRVSKMKGRKKQMIRSLHQADGLLEDKKVLIADDDMRTVFALSRLLSEQGMKALKAENGEKALRVLEQEEDVNLVLMDVMMPIMDGYEAMKRIRASEKLRHVPIIALTAKAMKEDRKKCLEAGANDYLPKPVDPQRLFSIMRVWLYR